MVCDFTNLPFPDNSFPFVVFDPPHLTGAKETAWLVKKYGKLDEDWPQMLHDGFQECMRVLKPDGGAHFQMVRVRHPGSGGLESYRTETLVRTPQRETQPDFLGVLYEVGGDGDAEC